MHRLFQERKIITYQFGVQLEVHQLVRLKPGRAGVPMMITTLGGPAINFKGSVDAYREAAAQSGFNPTSLPVATTSLFYTAKNSQDALSEYYPHINAGIFTLRGGGYPKQQFTNAIDYRDALMVGSPQQIIEKMLYQYELFGNNALWHKLILAVYHLIKLRKILNSLLLKFYQPLENIQQNK